MQLPLIALFLAAFAFGTTEFVVAGVLPQVAEGLSVSVPKAGYIVSAYAIGIALGGPLLTQATARLSRRTLLLGLTACFTLGQLACAVAPNFGAMIAARVGTAIVHGTFFGVAMVVATALVAPQRRGFAVALVLAGLTVSNIVGVPAGTAIGDTFGWRATFWAMFVLGIVSVAALVLLLPRDAPRPPGAGRFAAQIRTLRRQQVWTSVIIMLLLMMAQFIPFTYIAPLLSSVTGLAPETIPLVLLLNGIGCTLGVTLAGRLSDWRPMPALIVLLALQALIMAAMFAAAPYPLPMVAIVPLWGGINFASGTVLQARLLGWSADAPDLVSSLIPAVFNVGIAVAAIFGSMQLEAGFGYRSLPVPGIATMALATVVAVLSYAAERRSGLPMPRRAEAA